MLLLDGDGQHEPADAPALIERRSLRKSISFSASARGSRIDAGGRGDWDESHQQPRDLALFRGSGGRRRPIGAIRLCRDRSFANACGCPREGYEIETEMLIKGGPTRRAARARAHQPALRRRGEQTSTLARHHAHVLSGGTLPLLSGAAPVTESARPPRWHPRGLNNEWIVGGDLCGRLGGWPTWLTYRIGHVGTLARIPVAATGAAAGSSTTSGACFRRCPSANCGNPRPADLSQLRARHDPLHAEPARRPLR